MISYKRPYLQCGQRGSGEDPGGEPGLCEGPGHRGSEAHRGREADPGPGLRPRNAES